MSGDLPRGRRASDAMAAQQGAQLVEQGVLLRVQGEEIDKFRAFKHEQNNFTQKLASDVDGLVQDMKTLLGLSERVADVEKEQATHTVKCDERYKSIAEYMLDSKIDRKEIKDQQTATDKKIGDGSNRVLLGLLLAAVTIIGAFLWRFGLPPMP